LLTHLTYNATSIQQFHVLFYRIHLTYWRTPSYSFVRNFTFILIALIFASAYPQQQYNDYVATISRSAVIYIISVFWGFLSLITVTSIIAKERAVFYREQESKMYSVFIYCLAQFLIEVCWFLSCR
jgi:hypothetical protein